MVVKIAADHGDNGEARKSLFIGRDKEINEIIEDVKSNKGTRLLLVGESGVGKSCLTWDKTTREGDNNNTDKNTKTSRNIMLIDDEPDLLVAFKSILSTEG